MVTNVNLQNSSEIFSWIRSVPYTIKKSNYKVVISLQFLVIIKRLHQAKMAIAWTIDNIDADLITCFAYPLKHKRLQRLLYEPVALSMSMIEG